MCRTITVPFMRWSINSMLVERISPVKWIGGWRLKYGDNRSRRYDLVQGLVAIYFRFVYILSVLH
jgi:hypothetical protein